MNIRKIVGYVLNINSVAVLLSLGAMIALLISNAVQGYSLGVIAVVSVILAVICLIGGMVVAFRLEYQHPLSVGLKLAGLVALCISIFEILSVRIILISALFTWDPHNVLGWSAFYSSVVSMAFGVIAVITLIVSGFLNGNDSKKSEETK